MTTPGGVPNLPPGALTLDNLAARLQDLTPPSMRAWANEHTPAIFNASTGGDILSDLSPFGIITRIWAEVNSAIANADPADINGPEDLPGLFFDFIEGLPVVGQLVGLMEAILGTYTGDDAVLLAIQEIFFPIRKLLQLVSGQDVGLPTVEEVTAGWGHLGSAITAGLTTLTTIPAYLLSHLQPGAIQNVLPDPFFAAARFLEGSGLWNWSSLAPAGVPAGAGSVFIDAATAATHQLLGVPVRVPTPEQMAEQITVGAKVFWDSVAAAGQSFVVAINSYSGINLDGTLIEPPIADPNRVIASITDPIANSLSHPDADVNGFVQLLGEYIPPVGTQYAAISLEVADAVTEGIVHFGHAVFNLPSVIDASKLGNLSQIPTVPRDAVEGILGLGGLGSSLGSTVDTIYETITDTVTDGETSLQNLRNAFLALLGIAQNGQSLGQNAINLQGIVDNQMTSNGLESTIESNMPLQVLGTGPSYVAATQAGSRGAPVRMGKAKNIGFAQIWAYTDGSPTGFYLNFYKMNDSGGLDFLFRSTNLIASLGVGSGNANWLLYDFPGTSSDIPVVAGDSIAVGCQVVGSGAVYIAGVDQSGWMSNHPSSRTKRTGFSQNWGGGVPSSLAAGSVGWTGAAPYIGLGVSNANRDYHPPESASWPNPGVYNYPFPDWLQPGDYIDYAGLGAGAGGYSGAGYGGNGHGGNPGSWMAGVLRYGDGYDIPTATRSLTIAVGAGGLNGIFGDGSRPTSGGSSNIYGTGVSTITAAGGSAVLALGDPIGYGPSPSVVNVAGINYYAGGVQSGFSGNGVAPGGGGAGGNGTTQAFGPGGYGANGEVWLRARQA